MIKIKIKEADIPKLLEEIAKLPREEQDKLYRLADDRVYDRFLCMEAWLDYLNPDYKKALAFEYLSMKKQEEEK